MNLSDQTSQYPIIEEVDDETREAMMRHPAFNSAHEGYAVILEELDELWDEVKRHASKRDVAAMRREAIQVAAMAVRFVHDVCTDTSERQ